MEALVLTGIKSLELQDLQQPEVKPNEVKIHTAFAGICGTDHALYAGLPGVQHLLYPLLFWDTKIQVLLLKSDQQLQMLKLVTVSQ